MGEWEDPIQRAAVWYVAAFGAVTAVLIAGISFTSFDSSEARQPVAAVVVAAVAVSAAAWVGFAASRVLYPRWTSSALHDRYEKSSRTEAGDWRQVASRDPKVLAPLISEDGFDAPDDSLHGLWTRAHGGDEKAGERLRKMVSAANHRSSRRWYLALTTTTPVAVAVILAAALAWTALAKPERTVATTATPISVRVRLNDGVSAEQLFGAGCIAREREGVAIEGRLPQNALVALPATAACGSTIIQIVPEIGTVTSQ